MKGFFYIVYIKRLIKKRSSSSQRGRVVTMPHIHPYCRFIAACLFSVIVFMPQPSWGQDIKETAVAPPLTLEATRGLSQTISAEPLGAGRLTLSLTGSWYKQEIYFPLYSQVAGTHITNELTSFSFGVNPYVDVFGWVSGYGLFAPTAGDNRFGLGSMCGGIIGSLPLPSVSPLRLGAMASVISGTSTDQIDEKDADGYLYFRTRKGYDFMAKVMETILFGNEAQGIKFHFNQGAVFSLQEGRGLLMLLGGGVQGSIHPMLVLGLEVNSRTFVESIAFSTDPLWLTPSVQVRTPYYFNVHFGSDISLSKDRDFAPNKRSLEPFRIFGGLVFSFDLLAGKRNALAEQEKREAEERAAMEQKAKLMESRADSLARKAREDSLAMEKAKNMEKQRADSLVEKGRKDSIALAETQKRLEEERSKRSDAEKQLLSTGLLLLDAVYFETGKAEININSYPYLNIIGKMLTKYPKLKIEVSGHTDNVGRLNMNMMLSQARADAVRTYLIQVAPELSSMLTGRGYGPSQPKAPNTSADGRRMNRRVELQVLNKEALKEYNK